MRKKYFEILMMIIALTNTLVWVMIALNITRNTVSYVIGASLGVLFAVLIWMHYFRYSKHERGGKENIEKKYINNNSCCDGNYDWSFDWALSQRL